MVRGYYFIGPHAFETLGKGFNPPPRPPTDMIHIRVCDKTRMGKKPREQANQAFHLVHKSIQVTSSTPVMYSMGLLLILGSMRLSTKGGMAVLTRTVEGR